MSMDMVPYIAQISSQQPQFPANSLSTTAFISMISHAWIYPSTFICGLLVGYETTTGLEISETVPICHTATLSPSLIDSAIEVTNQRLFPLDSIPNSLDEFQQQQVNHENEVAAAPSTSSSSTSAKTILGLYVTPRIAPYFTQETYDSIRTLMPQPTTTTSTTHNASDGNKTTETAASKIDLSNPTVRRILHTNVDTLPANLWSILLQLTIITPQPLLMIVCLRKFLCLVFLVFLVLNLVLFCGVLVFLLCTCYFSS